jgi:hypothetical protein
MRQAAVYLKREEKTQRIAAAAIRAQRAKMEWTAN